MDDIRQLFPSINLEDKVMFEGGRDDVIPVDFTMIVGDIDDLIVELVGEPN